MTGIAGASVCQASPAGAEGPQGADAVTGSHDPADCELAVCDRCDSYGDGYSAGKDAAYFAIST